MKSVTAQQVAQAVRGEILAGSSDRTAEAVSTDTRRPMPRGIFVALEGERFDAHDYLDKAIEQGASIVICHRVPESINWGEAVVVKVKDTLLALQRLAAWYRRGLELDVVGITGSNGKTSTKDFTLAVLSAKYKVNATLGNLNNHIGLPLTVLKTSGEHHAGVWEMGMNHPGEIAPLCEIAQPKIGIITNIGTAHIEFLGTRDAIAEEKGALARALPQDGVLLVPASCDYVDYFKARTKAKVMVVGNGRGRVRAENLQMDLKGSSFDLIIEGEGRAVVHLPVVGKHMVTNALLAAAAGYVLGMDATTIADALSCTSLTSGRLRSFESGGVRVIDDTYNANPESVRAAIDTLSDLTLQSGGKRYVVLGRMAELGDHASQAYLELGGHGADLGLHVVSVGQEAKEIYQGASAGGRVASHFDSVEEAVSWLKSTCRPGDAVLFKGSRAAAMERVMEGAFTN